MDYLGGLGKAVGIRGGIPGHGLLAPDGEQGLCRADTTPERALRWLKDAILRRGVTPELVKPLSWHSFRVCIPDCALQMGPPGAPHVPWQLAHGEHGRCLRAGEAQRGCGDVPNLNLGPGRERREDLNHLDWADPLPPPVVDITDAGPEGREDQTEREGEASPSVPSGSVPSARSWSVVEHEPGDTPVKAKDLFPATPDLPLRVVAAVKRTGSAGQSRIHLLNVEGTAVGCGWRPAASKVQELSVLDYMTGGLWQVRALLQEAWLPGGLGTGTCGGPHVAGGLGHLGGLGQTEVVALPLVA